MKGCKLCEMLDYQQQQQQKLLLKSGSLTNSTSKLHTTGSRLLNYCNHRTSIRRSSTGSSGSACESNGSPSMSSASSSSSLLSVPSPTTSLPSPVAVPTAASTVVVSANSTAGAHQTGSTLGIPVPRSPRSSSLATNLEHAYHAILPPHFRDMFYATHLLRGYYQPAGPLISQHVHPPAQPSNASIVPSAKQIPSPLDPERDHHLSQISQQSSAENPDNDVLITGGDLSTFRYSSQQPQQGQAQQSQALSLASSQPPPPQQTSPYSRQIHPMHYPPYPPSYYTPYAGDAMCYPPPYQHYFPKVYQSAPTYRRYSSYYPPGPPPPPNDLYDPPLPPSNASQPPPSSGSQLITTGPSGPQHIEHYPGPPGFYTSYNPGGGECYPPRGMQPPYMEYPAPCPCPMQSCPKNVLTGPLIGSNSGNNSSSLSNNGTNSSNSASNTTLASTNINSITNSGNSIANKNNSNINTFNQQLKTNKGPVRMPNNNMMGHHEQAVPPPSSNLSSGQPILGKQIHHRHHPVTCKVELIEPLKSELKANVITESVISAESRKTGQYEETVVPPTPPSVFTVNDKLSEPDVILSPARGSTEPQTMPEKDESTGTQDKTIEVNNPAKLPQTHSSECENGKAIQTPTIGRKARIGKSMAREMMYGAHVINPALQHPAICGNHTCSHQTQHPHLASHNIAQDANNVPVPDSLQSCLTAEISRIKTENIKIEEEDDVVILEDDVKEVKCEAEVVEVLDKRLDLDDYRECRDIDDELLVPRLQAKRMKILDNRSSCKKSSPNGYKSLIKQAEPKSYLCLTTLKRDKSRHFRKYPRFGARGVIRKRKLVLTEQQKKRLAIRKQALLLIEKNKQQVKKMRTLAKKIVPPVEREGTRNKTVKSICHRIDFETTDLENDLNDSRGYFSEPDIRSSTSRNTKKTRSSETRSKSESKKSKCQKRPIADTNKTSTSDETMPKLPENNMLIAKFNTSENEQRTLKKSWQSKNSKKKSKSKDNQQNNVNSTCFTIGQSVTASLPVAVEPMVLDERSADENSSAEQNNNNDKAAELMELHQLATTSSYRSNSCGKRSRTRGSRFSRKRPKCRRYQMEVDNSIIPRKVNAVPKWNNGWSWLGEAFQAKIFLNSDDPLVIRTCYAAMQHIEGDIIRPRDCVLLKAGNKKNELPYVAKVAHLWENPEDGEMMMSLLWYYRPEHTEQGRQPNDCSDEVFASRHRDHNSVACIEDKCYVLTFSEYCRHRRRVRAAEEGIEGEHRIVPLLKIYNNIPPVTTNPEQVMFCQRVYEFRMKRLLKTPTN